MRGAVEDVLPSRLAARRGERRRSLADLDAFRHGVEVLRSLRAAEGDVLSNGTRERVVVEIEEAVLALAEGVQRFERGAKLEAIERSRTGFSRSLGLLLADAGIPPAEPVHGWARALESEVLPAVAGLARWTERLPEGGPGRRTRERNR